MDWVSAYHYAMILQEERLQRAQKPGWILSWQWVRRWPTTLRGRFATRTYAHRRTVAGRGRKSRHLGLARSRD
jgi:hypothetical protein